MIVFSLIDDTQFCENELFNQHLQGSDVTGSLTVLFHSNDVFCFQNSYTEHYILIFNIAARGWERTQPNYEYQWLRRSIPRDISLVIFPPSCMKKPIDLLFTLHQQGTKTSLLLILNMKTSQFYFEAHIQGSARNDPFCEKQCESLKKIVNLIEPRLSAQLSDTDHRAGQTVSRNSQKTDNFVYFFRLNTTSKTKL